MSEQPAVQQSGEGPRSAAPAGKLHKRQRGSAPPWTPCAAGYMPVTVTPWAEGEETRLFLINALKAGRTIDAAPQRARQKQPTAEEPVTARIRRRQEENVPSGREQGDEVRQGVALQSPTTFQQRVVLRRHRQQEGPELA